MKVETRTCASCKGPLTWTSAHPNHKYCCSRCQQTGKRKRMRLGPLTERIETRTCPECGEDFRWSSYCPHKKFCGNMCTHRVKDRNYYYRQKEINPHRMEDSRKRSKAWRESNIEKSICMRCTNKTYHGYNLCQECYNYLKGL